MATDPTPSLAATRRPGRPGSHVIVLFGATGDLARRKLLPGLFHLAAAGLLAERCRIVGTARSRGLSEAGFKQEPGPEMRLGEAKMIFRYEDSFRAANDLEAYEHLILDAMLGDQSLFTTAVGVERLWEISTPLLEHLPPVEPYPPGSWGPSSVDQVAAPYRWHLPEED